VKKIYTIVCLILVLSILGVGLVSVLDKDPTFSLVEKRELLTFPEITFSALLDGSFTRSLVAYYADTFPGREDLQDNSPLLNFLLNMEIGMEQQEVKEELKQETLP